MTRRSASSQRPLAPTAPRRRFSPEGSPSVDSSANSNATANAGEAGLNPVSSMSKVLRQRELASASRSRTARAKAAAAATTAATPSNASGSSSRRVRPVAAQVIRTPARSSGGSGLHPLSDGRANVPLCNSMGEEFDPEADPDSKDGKPSRTYLKEEVLACAKKLGALPGFNLLCIDTENKFISTGLAKDIANAAMGRYHQIAKADGKAIASVTNQALNAIKNQ